MKGDCKGTDYQYMLANCPSTCDICTEAEEQFNKIEAERMKSPTYEPQDSKVVTLTADTIDDFIGIDALLLIEFFAPWCGHCQETAPEFREAASLLEQASEAGTLPVPVKLAKFDDSDPQNEEYKAGSPEMWNFTSYPKMYIVQDGEVDDYWGGHETAEIVHHMSEVARGKNQSEARWSYHLIEKGLKPGFYKPGGKHESDQITELNPDNIRDTVLRDDAVWVVEFYSDKCPICNSLAPEIIKAATKAQAEQKTLKYGACNSRVYHELAESFGVTSYPWVAVFYNGKKVSDMAGMGGWQSFYKWGIEKNKELYDASLGPKLDAEIPPPPKEEGEGESDAEIEKKADPGEDEL